MYFHRIGVRCTQLLHECYLQHIQRGSSGMEKPGLEDDQTKLFAFLPIILKSTSNTCCIMLLNKHFCFDAASPVTKLFVDNFELCQGNDKMCERN